MSADFKLTPEQAEAVNARGGALLISAGAGSGKTRVLVERLLSRVFDTEDPCNIDEFLIITYTRAAAAELRERILSDLEKRLAADPQNRRLRRQSVLCRHAEIGTIHSFCASVVRENAHLLGVPPDFRVCDEIESAVIRTDVLNRVIEEQYDLMPPGFSILVDMLSPGRGDSRLNSIITEIYNKLSSHRDPDAWTAEILSFYGGKTGAGAAATPWGRYLIDESKKSAEYLLKYMNDTVICFSESEQRYLDCMQTVIKQIEFFLLGCETGWDAAAAAAKFTFPRLPSARGGAPEYIKNAWDKCKTGLRAIMRLINCTSAELAADMSAVSPALSALFDLTRVFRIAYSEEKNRRKILDFNDLEHLCAQLLTTPDGGSTPLAKEISSRYREVMADEFQDVSALQDILLRAVSGEGRKLVMVGDARQSIYRFRLADPSIFIRKYDEFETGEIGRRIILASNFRSRAGVLEAVNYVFARIMSRDAGELDYTPREYLIPGRSDADSPVRTELNIFDLSLLAAPESENSEDGGSEESESSKETEARFTAARIREIIENGFTIPDGDGGVRPADYNDVVILLRSVSGTAKLFRDALISYGIPVVSPEPDRFFEQKEIELALAYMTVIDNPRQDIPLISVLTNIYGFSPEELSAVRLAAPGDGFYEALLVHSADNEKTRRFLDDLDNYRAAAPDSPADDMLWRIFDNSGLLAAVSAWENGGARRKRLTRLAVLAREFENSGYRGIHSFLSYAERLRERGYTGGEESGGGGVRIMTIHKSKGLEFPIVFLPYLHKRFNTMDTREPVLLHPILGAGLKRVDFDRKIEYPTLPRIAIANRLHMEMVSEELRLLYVAMTRAREKLVMSCVFRNASSALSKLLPDADNPVSPYAVLNRSDIASVLMTAVLQRPESARLLDSNAAVSEYDNMWDIRYITRDIYDTATAVTYNRVTQTGKEAEDTAPAIPPPPEFIYPYPNVSELPSKLTVTELRGRSRRAEVSEDAERMFSGFKEPRRPGFINQNASLTSAERGTAVHLALSLIDYTKCGEPGGVGAELSRLEDEGLISTAQRESIDPEKLEAFFLSPTGLSAIQPFTEGRAYREFKFSLMRPAEDFYPGASGGSILFQGVADLVFEENGKLVVIDFKSDHLANKDAVTAKTNEYAYQIREYAYAMNRVTGLEVSRGAIFFISAGILSEVTL